VHFRGWVDDIAGFYASMDIFAITSRYEGLPYSLLDAMAHGLPTVGFDVPGVSDLVVPGTTGLLAPPGDVEALAAHAAFLIGNPDLRRAMGEAARRRIEPSFTLGSQVESLIRTYESLMPRR
jgi:glycosyltransferase involved in cell wall biosynthesis